MEIGKEYPINILTGKDYKMEVENNDIKARVAIVIKNKLDYKRQEELESANLGLMVIDVDVDVNTAGKGGDVDFDINDDNWS